MRVLVTGGLGFLGNAVAKRLVDDGLSPVALTSRAGAKSNIPGVEVVHSDIRDQRRLAEVVRRVAPNRVCHLAALTRVRDSFEDPLLYFDVNLGGTMALLRALEGRQVPIVFVSTGAVYGPCEGRITEAQPTLPTNPYGASKLAAEQLLVHQARAGKIGTTILRCFNMSGAVGGVGDLDTTRIIPKALAVAAGHATHIDINGDGSVVREFSHVTDVASAVVAALKSVQLGEANIYNVGSSIECTMSTVVEAVEAVTGRQVPRKHHPPRREPAILVADSQPFRGAFKWTPAHQNIESLVRDAWTIVQRGQPARD